MGCGESAERRPPEESIQAQSNDRIEPVSEEPAHITQPPSIERQGTDRGEDENVVLPKGEWIRAKGTPYYYSQTENLYFHPSSCQFYDPTNEMWYDSEKNEWYRDDEDETLENV